MGGRVLFGDDGSTSADLAWMWINAQDWRDWTVDVLTATNAAPAAGLAAIAWQPPCPRELINPGALLGVQHLRSTADPRVALLEYPGKDLVVVGPRGRGLLKSLHLGSTAEWLMHDPPAPLVIARRGLPVRKALVCTDGSTGALVAAQAFAKMPWLPDVDVTVVSVQQTGLDTASAVARSAALFEGNAASVAARAVAPDETDVFYHVRDIILSVLQSTGADILVQGSRGLSGWRAMRAGSIATSMAAHAPCSVFMAAEEPPPTA